MLKKSEKEGQLFMKFLGTSLSFIFLILLGSSFTLMILSYEDIYHFWGLSAMHLATVSTISLVCYLIIHTLRFRRQKNDWIQGNEKDHKQVMNLSDETILLRENFERFKRETFHCFRGILKVSLVFWIQYLQKERSKPFHEVKKDLLKDLKKEFSELLFMEEILSELKEELDRYQEPHQKEKPPEDPNQASPSSE